MTQISILGCGWLGLPLAKALLKNGYSVKGSTTSQEKLSIMENSGIMPFLIFLTATLCTGEGEESGNLDGFLEYSKILIIDVPPKLRGSGNENFVSKIKNVIPFIEKSSIEKVLFISSTSVYGEDNSMVTEETELNPDTESGKQLVQVEQLLQNNPNFKTTILRFGGLIGQDRHPVHFLAGRKNLENPNAPINLIHQEDCIGIILEILRAPEVSGKNDKLEWNETFNAAAPFHPSRQEYYTQKAIEFNLAAPEFNSENLTFGKTILSDKVETVLKYTFTKPKL